MTPTLPPEPHIISLLAQGSGGSTAAVSVVIWVGVLITALVGGGFLVMAIRRSLLAKDGPASAGGMMLDDLRGMRRRGELTDDEYEVARDALTSGLTGRKPPATPRRPATPARSEDSLVAPPGYDLTGRPLPQPEIRPQPAPPRRTPERGGGTGG